MLTTQAFVSLSIIISPFFMKQKFATAPGQTTFPINDPPDDQIFKPSPQPL
jgi:hypothetical protein